MRFCRLLVLVLSACALLAALPRQAAASSSVKFDYAYGQGGSAVVTNSVWAPNAETGPYHLTIGGVGLWATCYSAMNPINTNPWTANVVDANALTSPGTNTGLPGLTTTWGLTSTPVADPYAGSTHTWTSASDKLHSIEWLNDQMLTLDPATHTWIPTSGQADKDAQISSAIWWLSGTITSSSATGWEKLVDDSWGQSSDTSYLAIVPTGVWSPGAGFQPFLVKTPEPGMLALLACGLVGGLFGRRRRRTTV